MVGYHAGQFLMWCKDWIGWNLACWRRIYWSDYCRMLLRVTDGGVRVWRQDKSRIAHKHVQPALLSGGGSETI